MASSLSLVSESAMKELIDKSSNNLSYTKKIIETILQELLVDTNPLNIVSYLNVLNDYVMKNQTDKEISTKVIDKTFMYALGDEISNTESEENDNTKKTQTKTKTKTKVKNKKLFWIGSIRSINQHTNYLVRTSSAQLLGSLFLICIHYNFETLLNLVCPLLQDLVGDINKHVSRKATLNFSNVFINSAKHNKNKIILRNDFFMALCSLHGGQANTPLASKEDRHYIYNILIHCDFPNFHTFCIVVTLLQNCVLRLNVSNSISQNEIDLCRCLQSIKHNHSHFNNVYETSMRVRQHKNYGHLIQPSHEEPLQQPQQKQQ